MSLARCPLAFLALLVLISPFLETSAVVLASPSTFCTGPFQGGVVGELECPDDQPQSCKVKSVKETNTTITCDTLKAAALNATQIDPTLYGATEPNTHLVPMAHRYYYSRMNQAFGSCCPTDLGEIEDMELTVPWTGFPTGIAWDIGYRCRVFPRQCIFPTATSPFICYGKADSTPGVHGERLGAMNYIPVLTNSAVPGEGVWALFGQCWDANTAKTPRGSGSPVSWNVFSTKKEISPADKAAIRRKVAQLGFSNASPQALTNTYV